MADAERDLEGWTIAFDLDGALVETAPDIVGTLNRLPAQHALPVLPLEQARSLIGHGAVALLKRGFEAAGAEWEEAASPALLQSAPRNLGRGAKEEGILDEDIYNGHVARLPSDPGCRDAGGRASGRHPTAPPGPREANGQETLASMG